MSPLRKSLALSGDGGGGGWLLHLGTEDLRQKYQVPHVPGVLSEAAWGACPVESDSRQPSGQDVHVESVFPGDLARAGLEPPAGSGPSPFPGWGIDLELTRRKGDFRARLGFRGPAL